MSTFKTPFKDAVGPAAVPTKGSGGTYDSEPNLPGGLPGRDGGLLPELHRDKIEGKPPKDKPFPCDTGSMKFDL